MTDGANGNGNGLAEVLPAVLPVPSKGTTVLTVKVGSVPRHTGPIEMVVSGVTEDSFHIVPDSVVRGRLDEGLANDMVFANVALSSFLGYTGITEAVITISADGNAVGRARVAFAPEGSDEANAAANDPAVEQIVLHRDTIRRLQAEAAAAAAAEGGETDGHAEPATVVANGAPAQAAEAVPASEPVQATVEAAATDVVATAAAGEGDHPVVATAEPLATIAGSEPPPAQPASPTVQVTADPDGRTNVRVTVSTDTGHDIEVGAISVRASGTAAGQTGSTQGGTPSTALLTTETPEGNERKRYRWLTITCIVIAAALLFLSFLSSAGKLPQSMTVPCLLGVAAVGSLTIGSLRWRQTAEFNLGVLWSILWAAVAIISIIIGGK